MKQSSFSDFIASNTIEAEVKLHPADAIRHDSRIISNSRRFRLRFPEKILIDHDRHQIYEIKSKTFGSSNCFVCLRLPITNAAYAWWRKLLGTHHRNDASSSTWKPSQEVLSENFPGNSLEMQFRFTIFAFTHGCLMKTSGFIFRTFYSNETYVFHRMSVDSRCGVRTWGWLIHTFAANAFWN